MIVRELMTGAVITAPPWTPILEARSLMMKERIRDAACLMVDHPIGALPAEDGGRLVGIVTETDLLKAFIRMDAPVKVRRD